MATVGDPNFGNGFDADVFRTQIRNAMTMGLPESSEDRATFRWRTTKTFARADRGGSPYDFSEPAASVTAKPDVQVPVAVEFHTNSTVDRGTAMGRFDPTRAVITVLDEDYKQVEGANEVLLGGTSYDVQYVSPPMGLFSVTIYQIHVQSRDEV
jgi:hypothetical protein